MTISAGQLGSAVSEFLPNSLQKIVCHCLHVSQDEIEYRIESGAATTVKSVLRETGAGSGCTACHCTIRAMLEAAGHSVCCAAPENLVAAPGNLVGSEPVQLVG